MDDRLHSFRHLVRLTFGLFYQLIFGFFEQKTCFDRCHVRFQCVSVVTWIIVLFFKYFCTDKQTKLSLISIDFFPSTNKQHHLLPNEIAHHLNWFVHGNAKCAQRFILNVVRLMQIQTREHRLSQRTTVQPRHETRIQRIDNANNFTIFQRSDFHSILLQFGCETFFQSISKWISSEHDQWLTLTAVSNVNGGSALLLHRRPASIFGSIISMADIASSKPNNFLWWISSPSCSSAQKLNWIQSSWFGTPKKNILPLTDSRNSTVISFHS